MGSLILAGEKVSNDVYLPGDVERLNGQLQADDKLEHEFDLLPEGKGTCPPTTC